MTDRVAELEEEIRRLRGYMTPGQKEDVDMVMSEYRKRKAAEAERDAALATSAEIDSHRHRLIARVAELEEKARLHGEVRNADAHTLTDYRNRAEAAEARVRELGAQLAIATCTEERPAILRAQRAEARVRELEETQRKFGAVQEGLFKRAETAEARVREDRSYLITCPWCGERMESRPIGMQMAHVIGCGDRRIGDAESRERALREKARNLLDKMERIESSGEYRAVWTLAYRHIGTYRGERWADERDALRAALRPGQAGAKKRVEVPTLPGSSTPDWGMVCEGGER